MRLAYADPPYPGKAHLYAGHPDYAGEVDHGELIGSLAEYDGWALSTWSTDLRTLLPLCPPEVQVAAWIKTSYMPWRDGSGISREWEPVIYRQARRRAGNGTLPDWHKENSASTVRNDRIIGAKPRSFCYWVFELIGADPTDEFADLFPGTEGVADAWGSWGTQLRIPLVHKTWRPSETHKIARRQGGEQLPT